MNENPEKHGLNAMLYFLNYIPDVNADPILPENLINQIKTKYKPELVKAMCSAVKWSIENSDFDFSKQIPLRQSNSQINEYFKKVDLLFKASGVYQLYGDI